MANELDVFDKVAQGLLPNKINNIFDNNKVGQALIDTGGHIAKTAQVVGTTTETIWRKINSIPELKELLETLRANKGMKLAELAVDNLEEDLINKEPWATVQVLNKSRWGRELGFGEHLDIQTSLKPPEVIEIVRGEYKELPEEPKQLDAPNS
jgi:hypothetical protein